MNVVGLSGGIGSISVGLDHSCALTKAGALKCWGGNDFGQIGDDSVTTKLAPVDVTGLSGGVSAIGAGKLYTCALTTAGGLKCWGNNFAGELGNTSTTSSPVPVDVTGLTSGVASVALSPADCNSAHTCALTSAGGVKCWGGNDFGQIGDDSYTSRSSPEGVLGLANGMKAVATGGTHTCALSTAGGVKCWGSNYYGELGNSSVGQSQLHPVDVPGLASGVKAIAAGHNHTCAILETGAAKCWGRNQFGQLGNNSITNSPTPVDVEGLTSGAAAISAGSYHTCALTAAGAVKCWGNNSQGQIGNGTKRQHQLTPVDVLSDGIVSPSTNPSRLINLSTRGQVSTGDNVMIGGFIISGSTPKKVLVRAVGPNLASYGVTGVLANPMIELHRSSNGSIVASNDDWGSAANAAEVTATTLAPVNAKEAAILATLDPGAYTAIVTGNGGGTGVGIVEVYELDRPDAPLINISTRGSILTGDKIMIGGFIIQGDAPQTVMIRAVGPTLANYGVSGTISNPILELHKSSDGSIVASNDDWGSAANAAAMTATGLAPQNPLESAILITLQPGAYTAVVSGKNGGTGVGIVEVFAR